MSSVPPSSDEQQLHRHIDTLQQHLPDRFAGWLDRLRRPSARWIRVPAGILLICGGFLGFLPVLGFWMLPFGLLLLAIDIPLLQRPAAWLFGKIQHLLSKFAALRIPGR